MSLPIVKYPDPILLRAGEPVREFDEALAKLVDEMFWTMYEAGGVGLAAPQINRSLRLFVANAEYGSLLKDDENDDEFDRDAVRHLEHALINPEIIEATGEQLGEEGCLSIPNVSGKILRAETVRVRFQDLTGATKEETYSGYLARAIQHEYDHIEGRLYLDRMSPAQRALAERGLKKLRAEYEAKQKKRRRREEREARSKSRKKKVKR